MAGQFASRQTEQTFTASGASGEVTIVPNPSPDTDLSNNGMPVQVYGMHFTADGANATIFTVRNGAGDATLFTVNVVADGSYNLLTPWQADVGLRVQSSRSAGTVIVFHSSPGV